MTMRPITTGGTAMAVFVSAMRTLLPRKRDAPIAKPMGAPRTIPNAVDTRATWNVTPMMFQSSGEPSAISLTAVAIASMNTAMVRVPPATRRSGTNSGSP
jgi:hypothetical protein